MKPFPKNATLIREKVRCGRPGCTSCPHGPYWYAYWKQEGKLKKVYVGKEKPDYHPDALVEHGTANPPPVANEADWLALGVMAGTSFSHCRQAMRIITTAIARQLKTPEGKARKYELREQLQEVRLAFRRLFPGRR